MNKLFDLQFVIGLFFLIVGLLVLVYYLISVSNNGTVNLFCGIVFVLFGIIMLLASRVKTKRRKIYNPK